MRRTDSSDSDSDYEFEMSATERAIERFDLTSIIADTTARSATKSSDFNSVLKQLEKIQFAPGSTFTVGEDTFTIRGNGTALFNGEKIIPFGTISEFLPRDANGETLSGTSGGVAAYILQLLNQTTNLGKTSVRFEATLKKLQGEGRGGPASPPTLPVHVTTEANSDAAMPSIGQTPRGNALHNQGLAGSSGKANDSDLVDKFTSQLRTLSFDRPTSASDHDDGVDSFDETQPQNQNQEGTVPARKASVVVTGGGDTVGGSRSSTKTSIRVGTTTVPTAEALAKEQALRQEKVKRMKGLQPRAVVKPGPSTSS